MTKSQKLNALVRVLGNIEVIRGNEHFFFCPKHVHHKPKLSVNLETDKWQCWICSFNSKKWGLKILLELKGQTEDSINYLKNFQGEGDTPEKIYDNVVLPKEFRSLTKNWKTAKYCSAIYYLKNRNIDEKTILKYKLGYCEEGEYKDRIIIPSFDDQGNLNFFVGRTFKNDYRFKHGNFSKDIIWNDYLINWEKPVIITEGPFDAMIANENAIALQGSGLGNNSYLFRKIVANESEVYLALDKDAREKQIRMAKRFINYGISCKIVRLGDFKDVGNMTPEIFLKCKQNAIPIRNELDIVIQMVNC